ncbi:serine protease inhibitor 42Dd-like [Musca vetustissima]|uniref:serine protease inhibitor 42Dd-like n=1 Tax=Musca vetustissima TaxID=27455 RepID=UPI002AB7EB3A|nr:serine protease inhibitor 42Dd-like [Musca vetustissima]
MADNNTKFNRGGAELTIELLDKLQAATNKENVLISPMSIQTCMALAFTGAKGATADEIANVMKFPSNCPKDVANRFHQLLSKYENNKLVKMANKVYVQEGHTIKPEYAAITKEKYYASAESINFAENVAAANKINNWVEEKTSGQEKFDPEDTKEDDFWLNENESIQVEFMRKQGDFRLGYLPDYECEALEMPYKDSDLSMFVLLPVKRDGLKALAEKLKGVNLLDLDQQLSTASNMIVKFPKFKIEYSIELSKVMQEMGIKAAFAEADLSDLLVSAKGVYVSEIYHKTFIEVNEEGCEAASATGMIGLMGVNKALSQTADFSNILQASNNLKISQIFHKTSIIVNEEGTEAAAATGMKGMGIKTVFEAADLSNLLESETKGVYVSEIFHKTSIEVNEEGCEAAAATGLVATFRCMPRQFMADCPFLYIIWNKKNILFAGAFVKPPQIAA